MRFSAGIGYDAHPFLKGRRLVLGGIEIPHEKGLAGHSDADVLVHAICDALLGAIGEGDLGRHFPDTDPKYQDVSSMRFLESVFEKVTAKGFRIQNLDAVVIAQEPRLSPYIPQMRAAIAKALGLSEEAVNIKAKSNEGMGFIGRGEGIAAQAIGALIKETS